MRLGSIISETLRNIASGTAHALTMFLAVLFAGTLLGGYEAMSVMRLETEAAVRIRAFADVKNRGRRQCRRTRLRPALRPWRPVVHFRGDAVRPAGRAAGNERHRTVII